MVRLATLEKLAKQYREAIDQVAVSNQIEWSPQQGPQTQAYLSEADELFYGGSAGGGKTDLILGLALTSHRNSIIFRREYPQLKGLVKRSREIIKSLGKYNSQEKIWNNLPEGRSLEFGAVQYEDDVEKYQGRAHDLKAFDEITHFMESQYRFLIGWARSTIPGQRVRIVATGNPPTTPEGQWVVRYWAPWLDTNHPDYPAVPGALRWFAVIDGEDTQVEDGKAFEHNGELIIPRSRTFIPARLEDNAYLSSSNYRSVLQGMPEPLRSQMLYGDFSIQADDDPWQIIPTQWVILAQERWKARSHPSMALTGLGVDVARGGKDSTAIARIYGNWFAPVEVHPGTSTPDGPAVAALVARAFQAQSYINVDVIGVGGSVYDSLKAQGYPVRGVNFAERSDAMDKSGQLGFANLRAEAWWKMREALDPSSGLDIALPDDRRLLSHLCAPKWKLMPKGIQVESKQDVIKRIGESPDLGDAVVLALMQPHKPAVFKTSSARWSR